MKKKMVALLCAAALTFGVPTTAFAIDAPVDASGNVTLGGTVKGSNANVALSNMSFTGIDSSIQIIRVDRAAATPSLPSNAIPGSGSAFKIDGKGNDFSADMVTNSFGQYARFTCTCVIDPQVIANLPAGVSADNIFLCGQFTNSVGDMKMDMGTQRLSNDLKASISIEGVSAGTLTLWLQNGKYAVADDNAVADDDAVEPDVDDSDDEPRIIDGMPELPVAGSSGVVAWGNLAGINVPAGAAVSLSAATLTSGTAYDELRAAMGPGRVIGAYQVDMKNVDGEEIHNGFGELNLAFPVSYGLDNRAATVWHRHNDGSITSERTTVVGSEVHITTRDLSDFVIELGASESAVSDDGTTSPKTGQSVPMGAPLVALATVIALGAASVLLAKRKMMR